MQSQDRMLQLAIAMPKSEQAIVTVTTQTLNWYRPFDLAFQTILGLILAGPDNESCTDEGVILQRLESAAESLIQDHVEEIRLFNAKRVLIPEIESEFQSLASSTSGTTVATAALRQLTSLTSSSSSSSNCSSNYFKKPSVTGSEDPTESSAHHDLPGMTDFEEALSFFCFNVRKWGREPRVPDIFKSKNTLKLSIKKRLIFYLYIY